MPLQRIEDWDEIDPPVRLVERAVKPIASSFVKLNRAAASQAAMSGDNWHNNLLALVASWVAKGNTDEEIHILAAEKTLLGYTPEQTFDEVQKMVSSARSKGFDQTGSNKTVAASPELTLKKNGEPHPNVHNILTVLTQNESWYGVFAFDEFADRKKIIKTPPYEALVEQEDCSRELRDEDYSQTQAWLNKNGFPTVGREPVTSAVNLLCREAVISPVRHYLGTLTFDPNKDRPAGATWMEDYLGVKPESEAERKYVRAIAIKSLVQAVARALVPGCKADSVPILEGKQGTGKSEAVRVLFGADWFGDSLPPMGHKDASDYLKGKWAIELAEMSFQSKADIEQQKAFISRQEERYRPAYGRQEVTYPRRCVFWGTTNRDDYLKDETGNRRFWPIKTGEVDIEGLKAARDRLWAEAVYHYRQGMEWWLDPAMQVFAEVQNSQRFERDVWEQDVQRWVNDENIQETTLRDALHGALMIMADKMTQADQRRMRTVLKFVGFEKCGVYKNRTKRDQARYVRVMGE